MTQSESITDQQLLFIVDRLHDLLEPVVNMFTYRCVQAWLGYANVLFLGFGKNVLSPVARGEKHPIPTYELQTHFANWAVYGREDSSYVPLATSEDEYDKLNEVIQQLVGRRVKSWSYTSTFILSIRFENEICLEIVPLQESEFYGKEAWSVRKPHGKYLEALNVDKDLPYRFFAPHVYTK